MMKWILLITITLIAQFSQGADYTRLVPFVKLHEGGYVIFKTEEQETNVGVQYTTWKHYFGNTHSRFMIMDDLDWMQIWKTGYWDIIQGDSIDDQNLAENMAEWCWMSGSRSPIKALQKCLKLKQTGSMNKQTLFEANHSSKLGLYLDFTTERIKYIVNLPLADPKYKPYINGWVSRWQALLFYQYSLDIIQCQ